MGSFNENTVAARGDVGLVRTAAAQLGPAAGHRLAAGAIWFYDEGASSATASPQTAVGCAPPDGSFRRWVRCSPSTISPRRPGATCDSPMAWAPPEINVVRIVADDPNLSTDQWFGFTPPRVPVLQTAQVPRLGETPILMDIATAANFPCQRPFVEHLGVAEVPSTGSCPTSQVVVSSNMWQSARSGGPFLFIQALLTTATIPTYLRNDWYRDWGALERLSGWCPRARRRTPSSTRVPKTVFGWGRTGPIRGLYCRDRGPADTDSRKPTPATPPATSRSPAGWPPSPG